MSQYFSGLTDSCRRASAYICMPAVSNHRLGQKKKVKLALNVKRRRSCGDANELFCLGSPELMTNCNKVRYVCGGPGHGFIAALVFLRLHSNFVHWQVSISRTGPY